MTFFWVENIHLFRAHGKARQKTNQIVGPCGRQINQAWFFGGFFGFFAFCALVHALHCMEELFGAKLRDWGFINITPYIVEKNPI